MADKRPPLPEDDDGRTIANMDVEGMPWHIDKQEKQPQGKGTPMSRQEAWMYAWAAVRGGLMLFLVFAAIYALVIFLIGHVWGA